MTIERHLMENLGKYLPIMFDTLDMRYGARRVPPNTIVFRGQWLRPMNFDACTPSQDHAML